MSYFSVSDMRSPERRESASAPDAGGSPLAFPLTLQPVPAGKRAPPQPLAASTIDSANTAQILSSDASRRPPLSVSEFASALSPSSNSGSQTLGGTADSQTATANMQDSFMQVGSPARVASLLDASFRSSTAGGPSSGAAAIAAATQAKTVASLNEMLARSRDGLHKLQSELEVERSRRLACERDLADVKRELSNERLSSSGSGHHLQLAADKEARLMRELALAKLLEQQLRTEMSEEATEARREKEDRIRLEERAEAQAEETRHLADTLRLREEELKRLRDSSSKEVTAAQVSLANCRKELRAAQEEVQSKSAALRELEVGMQAVGARLVGLDTDKAARESARLLEEQRLQSKIAESQAALTTSQSSAEALRAENARLVALTQESATQTATLSERLHAKAHEAETVSLELSHVKHARDQQLVEHTEQLHAMQDRFEAHLQEVESSYRERLHALQTTGVEEQRRTFELAMDQLQRELDRALHNGVAGRDVSISPTTPSSSEPAFTFHSPSSSSPSRTLADSDDPALHSSLQSFYTSALSLFQSTLLSRLATAFTAMHKTAERREYDAVTQVSLLKQDIEFHVVQATERRASEESLATRLQDLTASSSSELKKLRTQLHSSEQLLVERANVIRELKKRYKREQATSAGLKSQLATVVQQQGATNHAHHSDLASLRDQSTAELANSLRAADAIAQKRLDAERSLRHQAETESDKYVRACQQAEERVFLLQQEKQTLVSFVKQQMGEIASQNAVAALAAAASAVPPRPIGRAATHAAAAAVMADSDARIARIMANHSTSPTAAAAAARFYSPTSWQQPY